MLIYMLSVSYIHTNCKIKNINKKIILNNVIKINNFYKEKLQNISL